MPTYGNNQADPSLFQDITQSTALNPWNPQYSDLDSLNKGLAGSSNINGLSFDNLSNLYKPVALGLSAYDTFVGPNSQRAARGQNIEASKASVEANRMQNYNTAQQVADNRARQTEHNRQRQYGGEYVEPNAPVYKTSYGDVG